MAPALYPSCMPFPWVVEVECPTHSSSIVVQDSLELRRCFEERGLTKLRLTAIAQLSEDRSIVVVRADAARIELLRAAQGMGSITYDTYLDIRHGQFDFVVRVRHQHE